jgi:tetratricopeptide (TPR) repeat protein
VKQKHGCRRCTVMGRIAARGQRLCVAAASGALVGLGALWGVGCAATAPAASGPYQSQAESQRDNAKAQRLTLEAAELMTKDPAQAEALLREALTADLYHGPAHNNLGVLHLKMDPPQLYEAASEFEWARKLMPGHPDPRVNLAMTLEQAGRTDDALDVYQTALEVYPRYLPAVQGLARLQIRSGKPDERTAALLEEIAMRGETQSWRDWARRQQLAAAGSPADVTK